MGSSASVEPSKTTQEVVILQPEPTVNVQKQDNQEAQTTKAPNVNSNKTNAKINQNLPLSLQKNSSPKTKKSPINSINKYIPDVYVSDSMMIQDKSSPYINKSRINEPSNKKNIINLNQHPHQLIISNKKSPNNNNNLNGGVSVINNESPIRNKAVSNRSLDKHVEKELSKSTNALKALNMKLIATSGGANAQLTKISSSTTNLPSSKTTLYPLSSSKKKIAIIHQSRTNLTNNTSQKQPLSLPKVVHPLSESDRLINSKARSKSKSKLKKIDAKINQLIKLYGI